MTAASFPGPGSDGEALPPGVPARDEAGHRAAEAGAGFAWVPDDDWDADADMARTLAACEAGLISIPDEPGGAGIVAGTVVDRRSWRRSARPGGWPGPVSGRSPRAGQVMCCLPGRC